MVKSDNEDSNCETVEATRRLEDGQDSRERRQLIEGYEVLLREQESDSIARRDLERQQRREELRESWPRWCLLFENENVLVDAIPMFVGVVPEMCCSSNVK